MGSIAAMENGSKTVISRMMLRNRPEGVEGRVAYKGTVEDTVFQLMGGLRSGNKGLLRNPDYRGTEGNGRFIKISAASLKGKPPSRHPYHQGSSLTTVWMNKEVNGASL